MEFRLLGPLQVWVGDNKIDLGPRKRRAILGVLLLDTGRTVSVDRLVDLVWGDDPPDAARQTVTVHISRIRAMLAAAGAAPSEVSLTTTDHGYVLLANREAIDLFRFRALVARAATTVDAGRRSEVLQEALALWRGPMLADLADEDVRDRLCAGLDELRLTALGDRIDADLQCGRHAEVIPELLELTALHPMHEGLAGQLMVAYYRAGQRAKAIDTFDHLRKRLSDDLGVLPGSDVSRQFELVLKGDPSLDLAAPRSRGGADSDVGESVPRQLPAAARGFHGRTLVLDEMDRITADTGSSGIPIVAIVGMGGIGKTALAVFWAHRVAAHYPDGQLYANLRGFASSSPAAPMDVLAGFLRALDVDPAKVPASLDEAASLYRSILAQRRVLVLLDNVYDAEEARLLLPGGSGNLVIVTSRDRLAGLAAIDGAQAIELPALDPAEAVALLGALVGEDITAVEPAATLAVARHCSFLPLALRIAATNFDRRRYPTLREYVDALIAADRLGGLTIGGDERGSVASVFSWSYHHLPADLQRAFRLVGSQPFATWDVYAVAALLDVRVIAAGRMLDELERQHLVERSGVHRYGMHDLLASYAVDLTQPDEARPAIGRVLDYYRAATASAMDTHLPGEAHRRPRIDPVASEVPVFPHATDATAWLAAELPNLVTIASIGKDWPLHCRDITHLTGSYMVVTCHYAEASTMYHAAIDVANAAGDRTAEARALHYLGRLQLQIGHVSEALDLLTRALELYRQGSDRLGQAIVATTLGNLRRDAGANDVASELYVTALRIFDELGDAIGRIATLNNLGCVRQYQSRLDEAETYFLEAAAVARQIGHRRHEMYALSNLGPNRHRQMRYAEALECLESALEFAQSIDDPAFEATMIHSVGATHLRLGDLDLATDYLERALERLRAVSIRTEEAETLIFLAEIAFLRVQYQRANELAEEGLAIAQNVDRRVEAQALLRLGLIHTAAGEPSAARERLQAAASVAEAIEDPECRAMAFVAIAELDRASGNFAAAYVQYEQALRLARPAHALRAEVEARQSLACTLRADGRVAEADEQERMALRLADTSAAARS